MSLPISSPATGVVPAGAAPKAGGAAAPASVPAPAPFSTPAALAAMLKTSTRISDLFFTPGKPPLVEISGKLTPAGITRTLTSDDTLKIGCDLIGNNSHAVKNLKEIGYWD